VRMEQHLHLRAVQVWFRWYTVFGKKCEPWWSEKYSRP